MRHFLALWSLLSQTIDINAAHACFDDKVDAHGTFGIEIGERMIGNLIWQMKGVFDFMAQRLPDAEALVQIDATEGWAAISGELDVTWQVNLNAAHASFYLHGILARLYWRTGEVNGDASHTSFDWSLLKEHHSADGN